MRTQVHAEFNHFLCTEEEVFGLLSTLDCSKTSPDGTSARMLGETAISTAQLLICPLSSVPFQCCGSLQMWSLYLRDLATSQNSPSNFRPISLLPILSKRFEKHLYRLLHEHLQTYYSISERQWG